MVVVDTYGPAFTDDPHTLLRDARRQGPVAYDGSGTPVLLRYDDVDGALRDPRFINDYDGLLTRHGITSGPLYDWWKLAMLNTNPPVHARLRQLASRAFTPRAADATRARIRVLTEQHFDRQPRDEAFDFIEQVSETLPLTIVCDMVGVPTADHATFNAWVSDIGLMFSDAIPDENRRLAETAMVALHDYVVRLIEDRRRAPDDTLISSLIAIEEGGDRLSYDELVALVVNLMLGALDTSRSALSIGLWLLVRNRSSTITPSAVEEILRYEPPSGELRRTAGEDLTIAGAEVAAGTDVALSVLSANRDPDAFDDPDRFVAARYAAAARPHLSFGRGAHFCLGNSIARVEMQEVLGVLLAQYPALEIVTDEPRWVPYLRIRRFEELRIVLGPKALRDGA